MVNVDLDTIEEVTDLRSVWPHEAHDFTQWLAKSENIELLSNTIGIDIDVLETESSVGRFNADILAVESGTDRKIIIENQLEETNHDHLGKLITYLAGKDAKIIIWLVKHARDEHKAAIEWLNNNTPPDVGFFLCEIKLFKIGNSKPALKFEVIEEPNNFNKISNNKVSNSEVNNYNFWKEFFDTAAESDIYNKNFKLRKPNEKSYMTFSLNSSKYYLAVNKRKDNTISVGLEFKDGQEFIDNIYEDKDKLESALGMSIIKGNAKHFSFIAITKTFDNLYSKDTYEWIINTLVSMKNVFKPYLDELDNI